MDCGVWFSLVIYTRVSSTLLGGHPRLEPFTANLGHSPPDKSGEQPRPRCKFRYLYSVSIDTHASCNTTPNALAGQTREVKSNVYVNRLPGWATV